MPTQEEGQYHPDPQAPVRIRVALAPRAQPFDESMDSLYFAIQVAKVAGFHIVLEKVRRGCPGFQNAGPVINHFLKAGESHLFLAADDMLYPPDTILRLVNDNKDIVSGIYRKNVLPDMQPANHVETAEKFVEMYKEGGVYESQYMACHTATIKRAVIEKMVADYPELEYVDDSTKETHYGLFLPIIQDKQCFQDDWAFSIRARQSGFTIWNDYGCHLKHYCGEFLGMEVQDNAGS